MAGNAVLLAKLPVFRLHHTELAIGLERQHVRRKLSNSVFESALIDSLQGDCTVAFSIFSRHLLNKD
jgi:hypothetical protein